MPLTLNQLVSRLQSLSLSHRQVNHFYLGDVPEFDSQTDITYPAVFAEQQPGTINRAEKQQTFNFRLYFVDLVNVSTDTEANETEVLSDMTSVAGDMLAMLMNPLYQDDWEIANSAVISPVTESLGDMVAGVVLEVGIIVNWVADSCQVPADDVEFEQTFDMARTKLHTYEGTGSEGSTWAIAFLSGKQILAVYRAGQYKRPIAVFPTGTSEKIQVGTFDSGSDNGIIGDGTVTLDTGDGLVAGEILDFLYYST
jgi:hypothetical protein